MALAQLIVTAIVDGQLPIPADGPNGSAVPDDQLVEALGQLRALAEALAAGAGEETEQGRGRPLPPAGRSADGAQAVDGDGTDDGAAPDEQAVVPADDPVQPPAADDPSAPRTPSTRPPEEALGRATRPRSAEAA